eukprot:6173177-Pleurochrysis_carterae.AAC.1
MYHHLAIFPYRLRFAQRARLRRGQGGRGGRARQGEEGRRHGRGRAGARSRKAGRLGFDSCGLSGDQKRKSFDLRANRSERWQQFLDVTCRLGGEQPAEHKMPFVPRRYM